MGTVKGPAATAGFYYTIVTPHTETWRWKCGEIFYFFLRERSMLLSIRCDLEVLISSGRFRV